MSRIIKIFNYKTTLISILFLTYLYLDIVNIYNYLHLNHVSVNYRDL